MISVIILTYNRCNQLIRCLDKLYGQGYDNFEVIVIDNGSTDKTIEILKSQSYPRLKIFENKEKANFSQARNIGIELASGDIIAFTDDDCVPADNWLSQIDKDLREYEAVGGIVLPYKQLHYPGWWHPEMGWMVGFSVPGHYDERAGRICYPQTANLSIRKSVLEKEKFQEMSVNFHNGESVYYSGREDVELWRRLRIKGYKIHFNPALIVYHDIPQERLDWNYLKKRAFIDGFTFYKREKKYSYIKIALNDIVSFPFVLVKSLYDNEEREKGNIYFHYFWMRRQFGVIKGYLEDKRLFSEIVYLIKEILKIIVGRIKGKFKWLFRKIFVFIYKLIWRRDRGKKFYKKISQNELKNILFIALGLLGDMVVIIPALKLIKTKYPDSKLSLLCYKNGYDLLSKENIVDEIIVLDKWSQKDKNNWLRNALKKLASRRFNAGIIHYFQYAIPRLLFKANIEYLISFDKDLAFSKQLWYDLLDEKIEKDLFINEIENSLKLLNRIGIEEVPERYELHFSKDEMSKREELLEHYKLKNKPLIAIHIGGLMEYKRWEEEKWIHLIKMIESLNKYTVIFVSGLDEKENVDRIINCGNLKALNLCGETNPRELCLLLKYCRLLITTDSGPKHIGFVADIPTVTLYGSLDYLRWQAYWNDSRHRAVKSRNLDLTYEETIGLPVNHLMQVITPEMVFEEVIKSLRVQEQCLF